MSEQRENVLIQNHIKHLELIQTVVSRMGANSANLKNYCMTMIAGIIGLAAAVKMPAILLYVLPIVFMFAVLDARYLHLEKGFRRKYDSLRGKDMVVATDFDLAPELDGKSFDPSTLFSWSVLWFYGPMVLLLVLLYFVM